MQTLQALQSLKLEVRPDHVVNIVWELPAAASASKVFGKQFGGSVALGTIDDILHQRMFTVCSLTDVQIWCWVCEKPASP